MSPEIEYIIRFIYMGNADFHTKKRHTQRKRERATHTQRADKMKSHKSKLINTNRSFEIQQQKRNPFWKKHSLLSIEYVP